MARKLDSNSDIKPINLFFELLSYKITQILIMKDMVKNTQK